MKQKNGFIAVSMIYSFFLVFLMIVLASSAKNAQTRQLLRTIKEDVKEELNQKEFIVIHLPKEEEYQISQEIDFVGDIWQVVENKTDSVVLVLKRELNTKEILESLEAEMDNETFFGEMCNESFCYVKMCTSKFSSKFCYYENQSNYLNYQWNNSIIKYVLERWLEKNVNLQKICRGQYNQEMEKRICQKDTLMEMTFSDGISSQKGYIRIPTNEEIQNAPTWLSNNLNAWTLTKEKVINGKNYIYSFTNSVIADEISMGIRPVIEVRKN